MRCPIVSRPGAKALSALAVLALTLAGCGSGLDSQYSRRRGSSFSAYAPHKVKPSEALEYSKNYEIHGIDVSKYQGPIDWQAVAGSDVQFAWIKATEGGNHMDSRFSENWAGAKAAGVPRGAYHFVYWCRPWREEMAWFIANVPVEPDALPPVLDVEATPESRTCRRTLYPQEVIPEMREMLLTMERHFGKKPIIYTTVDFYEAELSDGALKEFPIWVRSTKHYPSVRYGDRKWHFWQYQSDGSVPGIGANVDRNVFHGDAKEWQRWLAKN
ncbi:MAG: glycoside hydrolase family 25 protein [Hyphomicrobiales bacterium]|nr:glycoside hydrolase family 25 protein [Hyphomicrobiales bacterium]